MNAVKQDGLLQRLCNIQVTTTNDHSGKVTQITALRLNPVNEGNRRRSGKEIYLTVRYRYSVFTKGETATKIPHY